MCPTIVNNVETLCNIKHIIAMGGAEYARLGRPNNTGTRVLCVSGDVQRPGYFEVEVGAVTMGQLIYEMAGGLRPGRRLKAVIPGGSSAKVLRADERIKLKERQADGSTIEREIAIDDIPMDFDSLAAAGSMAGSGGVIVLDDSRDMVWALNNINKFYAHESCGQCTPCREGSLWMQKITDRMLRGCGVVEDPKTLKTIGDNIAGRTICAFGEACAWPTQSFVQKFPEEFASRAQKPIPPPLPPEYTSEELIEEESIPTVPMARDPGWEKAGAKVVEPGPNGSAPGCCTVPPSYFPGGGATLQPGSFSAAAPVSVTGCVKRYFQTASCSGLPSGPLGEKTQSSLCAQAIDRCRQKRW
jgi:hypothetical protein